MKGRSGCWLTPFGIASPDQTAFYCLPVLEQIIDEACCLGRLAQPVVFCRGRRAFDMGGIFVSYTLQVNDRLGRLKPAITALSGSFTGPRAMGRVCPDGGAVKPGVAQCSRTPAPRCAALVHRLAWLDAASVRKLTQQGRR